MGGGVSRKKHNTVEKTSSGLQELQGNFRELKFQTRYLDNFEMTVDAKPGYTQWIFKDPISTSVRKARLTIAKLQPERNTLDLFFQANMVRFHTMFLKLCLESS